MDFPWSPAPRLLGGRFCFLAVAPLRFARPAHRLRGNPVCRCVIRSARSFSSVSELPTLPQATKSFPHSFPIDGKAMHRYPVFARTPGDGLDGYRVEMVVRPSHWLKHMPRDWSFAEALKRPSYPRPCLTAWRALAAGGQLKAGQDVLVLGTGGVSVFVLQLARWVRGSS